MSKFYEILIVDDEVRLTHCLQLVLSIEGHSVKTASNGLEAYNYIKATYEAGGHLDLLITDICMPMMSGMELLEKLKPYPDKPVILGITGYMDSDTIMEFSNKGISGFIAKPFTTDELLSKIAEIMPD